MNPNTEEWFDNLTNKQKVIIWNKFVEDADGMGEDYKIYPMDEYTIGDYFPNTWDFASKVKADKWNACHYWWHINHSTGWIESIERLCDVMKEDLLESWATHTDTWPILEEMQNDGYDLDL